MKDAENTRPRRLGGQELLNLLGLFLGGLATFLVSTRTTAADEVTYIAQGAYGTSILTSGGNFTITFSVPSTLKGAFSAGSVDVTTEATFTAIGTSSGSFSFELPAEVTFFDVGLDGLFDINIGYPHPFVIPGTRQIDCPIPCERDTKGITILFGPQLFTENASRTEVTFLTPGSPLPITPLLPDGRPSFFLVPDFAGVSITGGTVAVTPEPSSLLLLGFGLLWLSWLFSPCGFSSVCPLSHSSGCGLQSRRFLARTEVS